ncbi:DnaJ (Hsp40), sub C, member 17 [Allomyces javanicus]|nr:DnaJ (Hsp40), sub C, member 17 [Allomyces javanicus]
MASSSNASNPLKDYDVQVDYYALLDITLDAEPGTIKKAYYKKSLELHPDKNRDNPNAATLFHQIKQAYELLSDEAAKTAYDAIVRQRQEQRARFEKMDAAKRQMREDLEARERAAELARKQTVKTELNRSAEIERLRSENAQKLRDHTAQLAHRTAASAHVARSTVSTSSPPTSDPAHRTLKCKWRVSRVQHTESTLRALFAPYGAVEQLLVAPIKPSKKTGTAVVQMARKENADAAMRAHTEGKLGKVDEVTWAAGSPPPVSEPVQAPAAAPARPTTASLGTAAATAAGARAILGQEADILRMMSARRVQPAASSGSAASGGAAGLTGGSSSV